MHYVVHWFNKLVKKGSLLNQSHSLPSLTHTYTLRLSIYYTCSWRSWTAPSEVAGWYVCRWGLVVKVEYNGVVYKPSVESQKPWGKVVSVVVKQVSSQLDMNEVDVWETFTLTRAVQGAQCCVSNLVRFTAVQNIGTHNTDHQLGFAGGEGTIQQLRVVCITLVSATFIVHEWVVSSST